MLKKIKTVAMEAMEGVLVEIETDISNNLPYFNIIGMADASVREASERVKRAIINSGFSYPKGKITVNLSPAYLHKKGSHYDLGIAICLMMSSGELKCSDSNTLFIGELSLGGEILPTKGVLPMIMSILERKDNGISEIILPKENCPECYLFTKGTGIKLVPAESLKKVVMHLQGETICEYREEIFETSTTSSLDFADVKGQYEAKEAIMTAIAGNHNLLMIGPPGSGKTMLAKCVPSILPKMTLKEQIETTKIYSYAGKLSSEKPIIRERPFRHLTPNVTVAALVGGGNSAMPGEISFAHNGVLFLDEMLEFPSRTLEQLRVPLEEKFFSLIRRGNIITFPSDFVLIGATNPCKCGFLGDEKKPCTCTQTEINQYRGKLSGAFADRIDMAVEVGRINYEEIEDSDINQRRLSSKEMLDVILRVGEVQKDRYKDSGFKNNANIESKYIDEFCDLTKEGQNFIKSLYEAHGMSPRRYYKILRISRTIADIRESKQVEPIHLAAAFHYTRFLMERGVQE